jgi:hypothetical protein
LPDWRDGSNGGLEIGPLDRHRRGVSIGAFLVWMLIAAAAGAVGWGIYGNEVRSQLWFDQDQTPSSPSASVATAPANDDLVAAVKDLQASEKLTADQLEAALVLLNARQASSKTLAYSLAALSAKLDALERPPAPAAKGTVGESAAKAPHRAPPPPVAITPERPNRRPRLDRRPRATSRRWRQIGRAGATPHGLKAAVSASA